MARSMKISSLISVLIIATSSLVAQTPSATPVEAALKIVQASSLPDVDLMSALESHLNDATLTTGSAGDVLSALSASKADTETILKLFGLFSGNRDQSAFAQAAIDAAIRQAAIEIAKPERLVPVLTAIDKAQPGMNKFAWKGGGNMQSYADLLAIYIDHCPPNDPILGKHLADIQIRHVTAASIHLPNDDFVKRLNNIDPSKLSRDKDRDQLEWLKMSGASRGNNRDEALKYARAIWARPTSQFRADAWRMVVDSLIAENKKTEAAAALEQVAKLPHNDEELEEYKQRIESLHPATQPVQP